VGSSNHHRAFYADDASLRIHAQVATDHLLGIASPQRSS